MAEDAEVETAATPDLPGEAAPVAPSVEPAPVAAAAPVIEAAPAEAPVVKAAKIARTPKAAKPAAVVAKAARPKLPRKAVKAAAKAPAAAKAVKPKSTRSSPPAASIAPQAAAAPLASPKVASRKTVKPRQTQKIGQGKPKLVPMKDLFMATPFDLTQIKTAFTDIQGKAKAALGDANAFTKGNVEAVVESGKILSAGLQDLGTNFVAETRGAFEGLTADAKELAAAKSPTEFFQLQSALARKQFDGAVAQASKSTEAWLKLANEAFAPLSGRVTLAVEKVSKAA